MPSYDSDFPNPPSATTAASNISSSVSKPSARDEFLAANTAVILGSTIAAHVAHHQYLVRRAPAAAGMAATTPSLRTMTRAGLAWAAVYAGVLSMTTIARIRVQNATCPVEAERRR